MMTDSHYGQGHQMKIARAQKGARAKDRVSVGSNVTTVPSMIRSRLPEPYGNVFGGPQKCNCS